MRTSPQDVRVHSLTSTANHVHSKVACDITSGLLASSLRLQGKSDHSNATRDDNNCNEEQRKGVEPVWEGSRTAA
eukprot:3863399-Amphidinium_carterae.1